MLDPTYIKKRYKNYSPTRKWQQKSIDYTNFDKPYTIDSNFKVIGVLKPDQREETELKDIQKLTDKGILTVIRRHGYAETDPSKLFDHHV